jgi:uncharacterized protein
MKQKLFRLNRNERGQLIQDLTGLIRDRGEILFAYLYGSFAEGMAFHDIDLGVYLSKAGEEDSVLYSLDLAHALSSKLRIPVDVRVLNFAPVAFLYHVIRGNLILDRDDEVRMPLVEMIIAKYLDMKPLMHRGIKEAFGR